MIPLTCAEHPKPPKPLYDSWKNVTIKSTVKTTKQPITGKVHPKQNNKTTKYEESTKTYRINHKYTTALNIKAAYNCHRFSVGQV